MLPTKMAGDDADPPRTPGGAGSPPPRTSFAPLKPKFGNMSEASKDSWVTWTCGVEAFKMLHVSEIKDSKNPGDSWAWTIPLMRLMNLHIVNYTKLCPIRMSEDAAVDDQVGVALRNGSSRKIWATNPSIARGRPQQRVHIVIESRADVTRLLLEYLDAGTPGRAPHLERADEGPQAAPAPQAGGRRRRSLA